MASSRVPNEHENQFAFERRKSEELEAHDQLALRRSSDVLEAHAANHSWDWPQYCVPSIANFSKLIHHSQDNAPGFDGLPYSAHDNESGISTLLMHSMLTSMRHFSPSLPPICLNSIIYFSAVSLKR